MPKRSLIDRLDAGEVIIGDGGMISNLERRGYVHNGFFTPEVLVEHPDAVRELHREFANSGADVLQALTFRTNNNSLRMRGIQSTCEEMSDIACRIAKEVAEESKRDILVAGGVNESKLYTGPESKNVVVAEFEAQMKKCVDNGVDFLIAEYFRYCEEICWAIETLKKANKPVVAMMNCGGEGDRLGISTADCAVKMAEAGADVIGLNCCFDPEHLVQALKEMKIALENAGYEKHLVCQPLAYWTPDAGKDGYSSLPEAPLALEPRTLTRFDMRKYARDAYEAGIRYIGGCCWFEAYHIREIADELSAEKGAKPPNYEKMGTWGSALDVVETLWINKRANRKYWENLIPATGRPSSKATSMTEYDPCWKGSNGLPV